MAQPQLDFDAKSSLDNPLFWDAVILTANKSFHVHKVTVSNHSAVMRKAFSSSFKEGETSEMDLTDEDPMIVAMALKHMYDEESGIKDLGFLDLTKLFHFAHSQMMPSLCSVALDHLTSGKFQISDPTTAADLFTALADVYGSIDSLIDALAAPLLGLVSKDLPSLFRSEPLRGFILDHPAASTIVGDQVEFGAEIIPLGRCPHCKVIAWCCFEPLRDNCYCRHCKRYSHAKIIDVRKYVIADYSRDVKTGKRS
ncbi:hypothetical protein BDZ85DRAFT_280800 [Elsinoe ampelina]|uniref:BTB domain-containing protein n=1 Tax=Elsinoe ampelina TaxID=302913 RepID=A0A6A6GES4_9PEZI|nr:hypothetical protein BDZ85DRAFT_280800 [Elsinoe ampelina]